MRFKSCANKVMLMTGTLALMSGCFGNREQPSSDSSSGIFSVIGESNESVETGKAYSQLEAKGMETKQLREQAAAVGRISLSGGENATGVLVAPDIIMTNSHVVNSGRVADPTGSISKYDQSVVKGMTFDNGYERGARSAPVGIKEVIMSNQDHDVAFIRLERPIEGVKPLKLETKKVVDAPAYVIGHPSGEYKQFSYYQAGKKADGTTVMENTRVSSFDDVKPNPDAKDDPYYDRKYKNAVMHNADTLPGSSGSPLISNGKVIGLHFGGFQAGGTGRYANTPHNAAISTSSIADLMKENREKLPPDLWSVFSE